MYAEESDRSWVCAGCIGEEFLRSSIKKEGTQGTGHYCNVLTIPPTEFAICVRQKRLARKCPDSSLSILSINSGILSVQNAF